MLRGPPIYEDKIYRDLRQKEAHEVPDIGAFLTDKKDACDKDNDAYPIDDVRHYAYEGKINHNGWPHIKIMLTMFLSIRRWKQLRFAV